MNFTFSCPVKDVRDIETNKQTNQGKQMKNNRNRSKFSCSVMHSVTRVSDVCFVPCMNRRYIAKYFVLF